MISENNQQGNNSADDENKPNDSPYLKGNNEGEFHDHFAELEEEIERGKKGKNYGLPMGFSRLSYATNGIQKRCLIGLFGAEGTGKSSFAISSYIMNPYDYARNTSWVDLKIIYYSLEVSKLDVMAKMTSWKIYHDELTVTSPGQLLSKSKAKRITPYIEERSKAAKEYINDLLNNCLTIIDKPMTPTEIKQDVYQFAKSRGKFYKDKSGILRYYPHNKNEHVIIIVDTLSNLMMEPVGGHISKKTTIDKHSDYSRDLYRNTFGYTIVNVMHSNRTLSSFNRVTTGEVFPDKGDILYTSQPAQDSNLIIAVFNPWDYISMNPSLKKYMGYEIDKMNGRFRAAGILKNRDGENNKRVGMLFVGECGYFKELDSVSSMGNQQYGYISNLGLSDTEDKKPEVNVSYNTE